MQQRTKMPRQNPALTTLVREHEAAVFQRALRLARDRNEACDLVQDTFERAFRTILSGHPPERERGWLLLTLKNLYIDRRRAARRTRLLPLFDDVAAASPETEESDWRSVEDEALERCLTLLDARLREAYLLRVSEGLSLAAIADKLGVPLATAGTRLHRARMQLRRLLLAPTVSESTTDPERDYDEPKTHASHVFGPTMPSTMSP